MHFIQFLYEQVFGVYPQNLNWNLYKLGYYIYIYITTDQVVHNFSFIVKLQIHDKLLMYVCVYMYSINLFQISTDFYFNEYLLKISHFSHEIFDNLN